MMDRARARRNAVGLLLAGAALSALPACRGLVPAAEAEEQGLLAVFRGPTPVEAAAWAVDPYDADKRQRGMLLLANAPYGGESVYLDVYRQALDDSDPAVRAVAVRALALHGGPADVPRILPMLEDEDRLLRWEAARALQRLHNPVAVEPLTRAVLERNERESEVRAASATALGQYAERRVLDALILALDDRDLLVNRAALDSLRTLTGRDYGFEMREWLAWLDGSGEPFAGRGAYEYPVFYRSPTWVEWIVPGLEPPNEVPSAPAGMAVSDVSGD